MDAVDFLRLRRSGGAKTPDSSLGLSKRVVERSSPLRIW
jgi:hypothetical protein